MTEYITVAADETVEARNGVIKLHGPDGFEGMRRAGRLAAEILDRAGVAVTPGLDFDPVRGGRTLRFSYARGSTDIAEGLDRLARFMATR